MQSNLNKDPEDQNSGASHYPIPPQSEPTYSAPPVNETPPSYSAHPESNPYAPPPLNNGYSNQGPPQYVPTGYNSTPVIVTEAQKDTNISFWLLGGSIFAYLVGFIVPFAGIFGFVANIVGAVYGSKGFKGGYPLGRLAFWLNLGVAIASVLGFILILLIVILAFGSSLTM